MESSRVAKPAPWITKKPFEYLLIDSIAMDECYKSRYIDCDWVVSFWGQGGERYSSDVCLIPNRNYRLNLQGNSNKIYQLVVSQIHRETKILLGKSSIIFTCGTLRIPKETSSEGIQLCHFRNNKRLSLNLELSSYTKECIGNFSATFSYMKSFSLFTNANMEWVCPSVGNYVEIPRVFSFPKGIGRNLLDQLKLQVLLQLQEQNNMDALSSAVVNKSILNEDSCKFDLHVDHQKVYMEVVDIKLSSELLNMYASHPINVTIRHGKKKCNEQKKLNNPLELSRMAKLSLPSSPPLKENAPLKSDCYDSSIYLGCVFDGEGHFNNLCELCLHDSRVGGLDTSIDELDVEVSVLFEVQRKQFIPLSVNSPARNTGTLSPVKPMSPTKVDASSISMSTFFNHHIVCKGKITRSMLQGVQNEPEDSDSQSDCDSQDSVRVKTKGLVSGQYLVQLETPPITVGIQRNAKGKSQEQKSTIVGNVLLNLFFPDVKESDKYSLTLVSAVNDLNFVASNPDSESHMQHEPSLDGSIGFLRQNTNRSHVMNLLSNTSSKLQQWFQLTDILDLAEYMESSCTDGLVKGPMDGERESFSAYFSSIESDAVKLDRLYDNLTIEELFQCLTFCGCRVMRWTSSISKEYSTKKMTFWLAGENDWLSIRLLNHKISSAAVDAFSAEKGKGNHLLPRRGDKHEMTHDNEDDSILLSIIRRAIHGLSCDSLCGFELYCSVLNAVKLNYVGLIPLWCFFQHWLQSNFVARLVECSVSAAETGETGFLSEHDALIDYLLEDDRSLAWVDCFYAFWAFRIIIFHEDVYRCGDDGRPSLFVNSCIKLSIDISHTLLLCAEKLLDFLSSRTKVFNMSNHDDVSKHVHAQLEKRVSYIITQIIRAVSLNAEIILDSVRQQDSFDRTLFLIARFSTRLLYCSDSITLETWQQFLAFLGSVLKIRLLQECNPTITAIGTLEYNNERYKATSASASIFKRSESFEIDEVLLTCCSAFCEKSFEKMNKFNFGKTVNMISLEPRESLSLDLAALAELLSVAICTQLDEARYKSMVFLAGLPAPPPQKRRYRTGANGVQLPPDVLIHKKFGNDASMYLELSTANMSSLQIDAPKEPTLVLSRLRGAAVLVYLDSINEYLNALTDSVDGSLISAGHKSYNNFVDHLSRDLSSTTVANEAGYVSPSTSVMSYLITVNDFLLYKLISTGEFSFADFMNKPNDQKSFAGNKAAEKLLENFIVDSVATSKDMDGQYLLPGLTILSENLRRIVSVKTALTSNSVNSSDVANFKVFSDTSNNSPKFSLLRSEYVPLLNILIDAFCVRSQVMVTVDQSRRADNPFNTNNNYAGFQGRNVWEAGLHDISFVRKLWKNLTGCVVSLLSCYSCSVIVNLSKAVSLCRDLTESMNQTTEKSSVLNESTLTPLEIMLKEVLRMFDELFQMLSDLIGVILFPSPSSDDQVHTHLVTEVRKELCCEFKVAAPLLIETMIILAYSLPVFGKLQNSKVSEEVVHDGMTNDELRTITAAIQQIRTSFLSTCVLIMGMLFRLRNMEEGRFAMDISEEFLQENDDILLMRHINRLIIYSINSGSNIFIDNEDSETSLDVVFSGNSKTGNGKLWRYLCKICPSFKSYLLMGGGGAVVIENITAGTKKSEVASDYSLEYLGAMIAWDSAAELAESKNRALETLRVVVNAINHASSHFVSSFKSEVSDTKAAILNVRDRIRRHMGIIRLYVTSSSFELDENSGYSIDSSESEWFSCFNDVARMASLQGAFTKLWWQLPYDEMQEKIVRFGLKDGANSGFFYLHKNSVLKSLREIFLLSANSKVQRRHGVTGSEVAAALLDDQESVSLSDFDDTDMIVKGVPVTRRFLDSLGGSWLGCQGIANMLIQKEVILDWLVNPLAKMIANKNESIDGLTNLLENHKINKVAVDAMLLLGDEGSGGLLSTKPSEFTGSATPFSTPSSPIPSGKSIGVLSPQIKISARFTNVNNSQQFQKLQQQYCFVLIAELERLHQLMRDVIVYLSKSGEWEVSFGVLKEMKKLYEEITLPFASSASSLFASTAARNIQQSWKFRKETILKEIDRAIDKITERLRHDESYRALPLSYAVRFLCSPWEIDQEEVNSSTSPLHLKAFYEATNFEVVAVNSEFKSGHVHRHSQFGPESSTMNSNFGASQRKRSRETWLILKYDIMSHLYTSQVYEQMVRLQKILNEDVKKREVDNMNKMFGYKEKAEEDKRFLGDRIPFKLPENTYFHLVEELRKAFPKFRIHSSVFLVEDKFSVPVKVIQVFPAYPVLPSCSRYSCGKDGVKSYPIALQECIDKLKCNVDSEFSEDPDEDIGGAKSSGIDETASVGSVDSEEEARKKTKVQLAKVSKLSRLTRMATILDLGSAEQEEPDDEDEEKVENNGPIDSLEISSWEMLSHPSDFYIYTGVDPSTVKENSKGDISFTVNQPIDEEVSMLRIKLSTKCVQRCADTFNSKTSTVPHNLFCERLSYNFSPSALAYVEESEKISLVTATYETLWYTKLVVLHGLKSLIHVQNMGVNEVQGEPMHDIISSRTLISSVIAHLCNFVGSPAIGCIGIHNAATTIAAETERRNSTWQNLRRNLKIDFNKQKEAYERTIKSVKASQSDTANDLFAYYDMEDPIVAAAPVELDYAVIERKLFGVMDKRLARLQRLKNELFFHIDNCLVALRDACLNITKQKGRDDDVTSQSSEELNLWFQLILWLESHFFTHETGSAL